MPWSFRTSYENRYRPPVKMNPDDMALYQTWRDTIRRQGDNWRYIENGPWTGHRYPMPERPLRFSATTLRVDLPNFLSAVIGEIIPPAIMDLIEKHEPGVHQYWPVRLECYDGGVQDRVMLNICNRLDTIDAERSDVIRLKVTGNYVPGSLSADNPRPFRPRETVLMKRSAIGSCALWCEYRYDGQRTFVSDALHDDLVAVGHEGIDFDSEAGLVD